MASPTQTIMFTAMARGIAIDTPTLPVSVLVSPRLTGAPTLDAFPDWLRWTKTPEGRRAEGDVRGERPFPYGDRRPEAAAARTLGRDLRQARPMSTITRSTITASGWSSPIPTRATLTLLKSIFQVGGLQLALPGEVSDENQGKRRGLLQLIDGMAVQLEHRSRTRTGAIGCASSQRTQTGACRRKPVGGRVQPVPDRARRAGTVCGRRTRQRRPAERHANCRRPAAPRRRSAPPARLAAAIRALSSPAAAEGRSSLPTSTR